MADKKNFRKLRKDVRADPDRAARVGQHKAAMEVAIDLASLRERAQKTQAQMATVMLMTQENVSRIERANDLYLSTLGRYVDALGGRLEIQAVFDDDVVPLGAIMNDRDKRAGKAARGSGGKRGRK